MKDIKLTNKKIVDTWINEIVEEKQKLVLIFITNDNKDTSRYEDIKEFFKNKNIGTQCISLKIVNKLLEDYKNKSKTLLYYLNNIVPQIAIKSGLNPEFFFINTLKSKCFVGLDVSHIPTLYNNKYTIYDACKDIYLLSFPSHMRGFVKLRLPMTIHYSDESSTNRNKDYLEEDVIYDKLLCP